MTALSWLTVPAALSLILATPVPPPGDGNITWSARAAGDETTVGSTTQSTVPAPGSGAPVPRYDLPGPVPVSDAGAASGRVWSSCTSVVGEVLVGEVTKTQGRLCPPVPVAVREPVVVEAGGPVSVTASDVATLLVEGSGITRQPPGEQVVVSMDLIVYTDPAARTLTTTVGGSQVTVVATPMSYTWDWDDGTTTTTTDPGRPYPHQTVTHRYDRRLKNTVRSPTLTTTWAATYTVEGTTTPQPVEGVITTTSTTTPFTLVRLVSVLTDDAEEAQGH